MSDAWTLERPTKIGRYWLLLPEHAEAALCLVDSDDLACGGVEMLENLELNHEETLRHGDGVGYEELPPGTLFAPALQPCVTAAAVAMARRAARRGCA